MAKSSLNSNLDKKPMILPSFARKLLIRTYRFFITGKDWLIAQFILAFLFCIRLMPLDRALHLTAKLARFFGPKTKRHKLALENLAIAFPQKTEQERQNIAIDMWVNMAYLAVEYVFLDEISKYNPDKPEESNLEIIGADIFSDLRINQRPFIIFTIHSGNFELLPIISQKYGLNISALFRPPNNRFIAKKVLSARNAHMSDLVPSRVGAAWSLARKLDSGGGVGMLVDQKFTTGRETLFFGHKVKTNPLLAKLVRQYKCDVFPARCIRLPGGRFRLELEPAITIPENENGDVDLDLVSQFLNDKVETWVRQYPGQWQWFHDRWAIRHLL